MGPGAADRQALRICIGEDDVLLREGIVRILVGAGLDVVSQSGDAEEMLHEVLAFRPDAKSLSRMYLRQERTFVPCHPMSALRHVWTALRWQGLSSVSARLVGAAMCSTC